MRLATAAIVTGLMLAHGVAQAEAGTAGYVERPLVLPTGTVQPTLILGITNLDGGSSDSLTGESLSAALDIGVAPNLQMGLYVSTSVNPVAFGSVLGNL